MARKKRGAEKSPPRPKRSAAEPRIRKGEKGLAPFPPPACDAPVWPHLWTLLAAGFALRLLAAFSSDWTYRSDEIMQYLEQAHRLVFGSGFMPWEIRIGARNLLIAAPAAGVMALCKSAGGGPDCYIPAIEFFYAAVSLAIPAALYFLGRRVYDETAGRVALVMGCFWYEFIVFAPRLMPEQTATVLIVVGLACVPPKEFARPAARLWLAGFLLGLGGLLRLPYIPAAGLLGILILLRLPPRRAPHLLGGALLSLAVAGGADFAVWGGFYHSAFAYLEASALTDNFRDVHFLEPTPWHIQIRKMAVCSAGLWPLILAAAATEWRRHWLALGVVAAVLIVHAVVNSHIYAYVLLAFPALSLALGGMASRPPEFLRAVFRGGNKRVAACVVALVSAAGAAHALPGMRDAFWWDLKHPRLLFYASPAASAGRFLSRVPPDKMRAALWTAVDPLWTGGYFYFHHPAPYWHEGLASHREMLRGRALSEIASHIAAPDARGAQRALAAGFAEAANFGGVRIFENPEPDRVAPVEKFPLGMRHRDDIQIDLALEQAGKTPPPPAFLPAQPPGR